MVQCVWGEHEQGWGSREVVLGLPAGGIRASQGTFIVNAFGRSTRRMTLGRMQHYVEYNNMVEKIYKVWSCFFFPLNTFKFFKYCETMSKIILLTSLKYIPFIHHRVSSGINIRPHGLRRNFGMAWPRRKTRDLSSRSIK